MSETKEKWSTGRIILFVLVCIGINVFGKALADGLSLPLWLDSIGTMWIAVEFGPMAGAIVGMAVNFIYGLKDPSAYIYALTSISVGVTIGICAKKKMLNQLFSVMTTAVITTIVAICISTPLNIFIYDGMPGNIWGDSVVLFLREREMNPILAACIGEFYVDFLDKIVSVFLVSLIVNKGFGKVKRKEKVATLALVLVSALVLSSFSPLISYAVEDKEINEESETLEEEDYTAYIEQIYNAENGLPGGTANAVAQTNDGMIWVGTYGGLYQYDGTSFEYMSDFSSVRNVNCLFVDEEGRMWIGTNDSGLSVCTDNEIVNIIDEDRGLPANSVRSIVSNPVESTYYIGTAKGLATVVLTDGVRVDSVISDLQYVHALDNSLDGFVVAVTTEGELAILENSAIIDSLEEKKYTTAIFDEQGILYAATMDKTIERYEIKDNKLQFLDELTCTGIETINKISFTENQDLFVCSDKGVGYFDHQLNWKMLDKNKFNNSIDDMLVDYQGNFWFSSSRLGLTKLYHPVFKDLYQKSHLEGKVVNAVTKWNGLYYVGTDEGLDIIDEVNRCGVTNELSETLVGKRIRCVMVDRKNALWISTNEDGLWKVENEGEITRFDTTNGLLGDTVRSTYEMSDGTIAVGMKNGISFIKDGKITDSLSRDEGIRVPVILSMTELNGALYVGTDGGGIAVIKNGKLKQTISRKSGLPSDIILRLVPDSKNEGVYVVGSNGIGYVSAKSEIKTIKSFPYYNNYDLQVVPGGKVWITSSAGIYVVDEKNLLNDKIEEYELLDAKTGLQISLTANSWNHMQDTGELLLCGDTGVVAVNTEEYGEQHESYRIMLETIKVNGVKNAVNKEDVTVIPRDTAKLELFPKVINYSVNDPCVSVQLEGFDEEPLIMNQSELTSQIYTNLPSGDYTFHLAILDSNHQKVMEEVTYTIVKEKEFYDNWWFNVYLFFILVLLIVYITWLIGGQRLARNMKYEKQEMENKMLQQTAKAAIAADTAKSQFLAQMSHDIRTPINAVLGMNEMILRESNQKEIFDYASNIKNAGQTLLTLINSILDFSKIEEGKMEIIPVEYETPPLFNELVQSVKERAEAKGLAFEVNIDEQLPVKLYGDDVRLTQVISNLLTNAVKYTEEGTVYFSVKELKREQARIWIEVRVKDTGIGIREEDMEKLFTSFQRLDEERNRNIEGTGLGMTIVTQLLKLMQSELKVESIYGKGSDFYFVLEQGIVEEEPIGDYKEHISFSVESMENEVHIYAPKAKVLVVDDNEMNLKVAKSLLEVTGIVPDTAASGKQAIELVKDNTYDVILLDHMMPLMDGIETLQCMRNDHLLSASTKVIVLTANAIVGAREQYLQAGFDDYMSKPIDMRTLEGKLKLYLPAEYVGECTVGDYKKDIEVSEVSEDEFAFEELMILRDLCPELNVMQGLMYCMDDKSMYVTFLQEYVENDGRQELTDYLEKEDWDDYRIRVHALKSNSLSIGAALLSEHAKALEFAIKENHMDYVKQHHDEVMAEYEALLMGLQAYMEGETE